MASLAFRLTTLGPLRLLSADGQPVANGGKHLVLLAYLARAGARPVRREQLAALLWGEKDETRARQSLRQALLRLKRDVGDALRVTGDDAVIEAGALELDLAALGDDLQAGRWREAVERWQGDFLTGHEDAGGEEYRVWLEAERATLRRNVATALARLVEDAGTRGAIEEALAHAARWTELAPLEEEAHIRRIALLCRAGHPADAIALHRAFHERVVEERIEPSPGFLQLGEQLARTRVSAHAPSAALRSPALIARGAQMGALRSLWSNIAESPAFVVVEGEHGSGRTRLCREFLQVVRATRGAVVLDAAACREDTAPFATARRLLAGLRFAPGLAGAADADLAVLAEILPTLRERFARLPAAAADQARLAPALCEVLAAVTAESPVLILLDDAAAADGETLRLLSELGERQPAGVLIVLTAPSGWLDARAGVGLAARRQIKLPPLTESETAELVASMVDLAPNTRSRVAAELHAETRGNPLYVAALVSGYADSGRLYVDTAGGWRFNDASAGNGDALLPSVREAVRTRIAELDDNALFVLDAIALSEGPADPATVDTIAAGAGVDAAAGIAQLVAAGFIEAIHGGTGYAFRQRIVRRAVAEMIPPARRRAIASAATPTHRRRVAWLRAAVLAAVALGGLLAFRLFDRDNGLIAANAHRLVVVAFRNETGRPDLDPVGRIAADWLTQGIARTALLKVTPPLLELIDEDERPLSLDRAAGVRAVARETEADLVIWGSYYLRGDSLRLQARVVDTRSGRVVTSPPTVTASLSNPMDGLETLLGKTLAALGPLVDARLAGSAALSGSPPTYEAYVEFSRGLDFVYQRLGTSALTHLSRAYQADTTWVLPLLYIGLIHVGEGRFKMADSLALHHLQPRRLLLTPYERALLDAMIARVHGDRPGYYAAARAGADIAPHSMMAAVDLPLAAIALNLPGEAFAVIQRINADSSDARDLPARWLAMSSALHLLGKYEQQLAIARQLEQRIPSETRALFYQGRALAALGRTSELEAVLQKGLALPTNASWGAHGLRMYVAIADELVAHGHREHARRVLARAVNVYGKAPPETRSIPKFRFDYAQALYRLGRFSEARTMFEDLLNLDVMGASPNVIRAHLAFIAAAQGDMRTVRESEEWLIRNRGEFDFGWSSILRAEIQAILGNREEAVRLLHQGVAEGYGFEASTHQIYEFDSLRGYPPFEEWLRPKG